jgi:hypothetical protein
MSAVERDLEAYEDVRSGLTEIAISTGAIKLDDDGETVTCSNGYCARTYSQRPDAEQLEAGSSC